MMQTNYERLTVLLYKRAWNLINEDDDDDDYRLTDFDQNLQIINTQNTALQII